MPEALVPGAFTALFTRLIVQVEVRASEALEASAILVEERARQSVSHATHDRATPTPAARGGPPAMISGTLAKSISHSKPEIGAGSLKVKIGMVGGNFAPYYAKTPSSLYAKYLELGEASRAHVGYPFLRKAFEVAHPAVLVTFRAAFSRSWL